jgi:hypothetical protein
MGEHDEQIQMIFEAISQLMAPPDQPPQKIGCRVEEKRAAYGDKKEGKSKH